MADTISGITTLNGTPTQARVTVIDTGDNSVAATALSDSGDGTFSFAGLGTGTYELLVMVDGKKPTVDGPWALEEELVVSGSFGNTTVGIPMANSLTITGGVPPYTLLAGWTAPSGSVLEVSGSTVIDAGATDTVDTGQTYSGTVEDSEGATAAFSGSVDVEEAATPDWFRVHTWGGDGSGDHTQASLDLSGGAMIWVKRRDTTGNDAIYIMSGPGATVYSFSTTNVTACSTGAATMDASGFTVPHNVSGGDYVAWVFKIQEGSFTIPTWTGDGTTGRTVAHGLGSTPKFLFTIPLTGTKINYGQHASRGGTKNIRLDSNGAEGTSNQQWNDTSADATNITLGSSTLVNGNTVPFAACVFGGDDVAAGQYTGNGSANAISGLGIAPYALILRSIASSRAWGMFDLVRGGSFTGTADAELRLASTSAESNASDVITSFDADGFTLPASAFYNSSGVTHIYLAIKDTSSCDVGTSVAYVTDYVTPLGLYSLTLENDSYAGACVRVRRSSDSTEQDIGFSGKDIDSSALETFVAGGTGYVVTWYDQSGNSDHLTQANTSLQPKITDGSGNYLGKIALSSVGNAWLKASTFNSPSDAAVTVFARGAWGEGGRNTTAPWIQANESGSGKVGFISGYISVASGVGTPGYFATALSGFTYTDKRYPAAGVDLSADDTDVMLYFDTAAATTPEQQYWYQSGTELAGGVQNATTNLTGSFNFTSLYVGCGSTNNRGQWCDLTRLVVCAGDQRSQRASIEAIP